MSFSPSSLARFTSMGGTYKGISKFILKQVGIVEPPKPKVRRAPTHTVIGIKNEKTVKQLYFEQTGNPIQPLNVKKEFTHYTINGRCDGVTCIGDKKYIIEIKTRSTNNFGMSKAELIQCLAYCVCADIGGLIFIEQGTSKELVISTYDNFLSDYIGVWMMVEFDLILLNNFITIFKADYQKYIGPDNKLMYNILLKYLYWV